MFCSKKRNPTSGSNLTIYGSSILEGVIIKAKKWKEPQCCIQWILTYSPPDTVFVLLKEHCNCYGYQLIAKTCYQYWPALVCSHQNTVIVLCYLVQKWEVFCCLLFCWDLMALKAVFSLNKLKYSCKTCCYLMCHKTWDSQSGWLYFKNQGFVSMGANYQRKKGIYTISASSASVNISLLHIITHIFHFKQ